MSPATGPQVTFVRLELNRILTLYGRMVSAGEWRDYALDFLDEVAVFSIFRRSSEMPLFRIEKQPRLRNRQGQYSVVAAGGVILKRGHELAQVLRIFDKKLLKAGNGPAVQKDNDVVTVYYKGELINGKVFDQTKPEEPAQFPVGGLIPGWVEALKLMKTGDTWELVIPSDLGYGADGAGGTIPPNATLVFVMTLAKVEYAP